MTFHPHDLTKPREGQSTVTYHPDDIAEVMRNNRPRLLGIANAVAADLARRQPEQTRKDGEHE